MKPMMVYSVLAMTALSTAAFAAGNQYGTAFNSEIQNNSPESLLTARTAVSHTLRGHIPAITKRMSDQGMVSGSQELSVTVALQLNNEAGLNAAIEAMYNPTSSTFHQFLTTEEFAARYAPTDAQVASEKALLESQGITVQEVFDNNLFIHATGTIAALNAAFKTELHKYVDKKGQEYFAPAYDVQTPASSRISSIVGLSNTAVIRNHLRKSIKPGITFEGTAPGGGLAPADIRTAYGVPSTLTGAGQTLALLELDGFTAANIAAYEKQFGLTATPVKTVAVDGASTKPSANGGEPEVELDIELMIALAPKATAINVYEGPNSSQGLIDTYAKIASDNTAKQASSSWGMPEVEAASSDLQSENTVFKQMVAQGQTLFSAAGDSGAEDDSNQPTDPTNATKALVDDPSGQPYVVAVGGTKMVMSTSAQWTSETTWNELNFTQDGQAEPLGAGGGGISSVWSIPSWQTGITADTQASKTMRNTPDVSLNADPLTGYGVYFADPSGNSGTTKAQWAPIGGTSAAAPLWAAFNALVNQNRVAKGLTATGFLNPALYAIGASANSAADFHDIADDSNNGTSSVNFKAVIGYDNATGWGSFQATRLLNDLSAK